MKKYIVQLMLFIIVCHTIAMEQVCYLSKMPQNVKDRIAHFLGWETKKAFVERTRVYSRNQKGLF